MDKFGKFFCGIFFFVGMVFLVVGILIKTDFFDRKNKVETVGTVVDIEVHRKSNRKRSGKTLVSYEVDGVKYESFYNGYSSNFYTGKEITIYYDENNPEKIGIDEVDNTIFIVFFGIGTLFVLIGGGLYIYTVVKKSNSNKLKENGEEILASFVSVEINTFFSRNGRHPYVIKCIWKDPYDGKIYDFKSENIWFNPNNIIIERNIKTFPVYINQNNNKKYYMDIDTIKDNVNI